MIFDWYKVNLNLKNKNDILVSLQGSWICETVRKLCIFLNFFSLKQFYLCKLIQSLPELIDATYLNTLLSMFYHILAPLFSWIIHKRRITIDTTLRCRELQRVYWNLTIFKLITTNNRVVSRKLKNIYFPSVNTPYRNTTRSCQHQHLFL